MGRLSRLLLVVALGLGLAFTMTAAPAQAASVVNGSDLYNDDWGDNYNELGNSLCNGCGESYNTDIVVMWQAILYAEGFLGKGDIDGKFGSGTASATKKWQSRYGLSADGKVGDATWSKADNRLWKSPAGYATYHASSYGDSRGIIHFSRGSYTGANGNYDLKFAYGQDGGLKTFSGDYIYFRQLTVL